MTAGVTAAGYPYAYQNIDQHTNDLVAVGTVVAAAAAAAADTDATAGTITVTGGTTTAVNTKGSGLCLRLFLLHNPQFVLLYKRLRGSE